MDTLRIWSCKCGALGFQQELIRDGGLAWLCPKCKSTQWDWEDSNEQQQSIPGIPFAVSAINGVCNRNFNV